MGKRGEHIVHLGRGGEGRGGFDMCASLHRRRSWLSEESFFVLSALSKSNPLFPVFFLARRPSSIEFFLLAVVLSPSSSSRRPLEGKTDGAFVHQTMDKWPSSNRYSLKAALMINYDPVGPNNGLIYNELDADHLVDFIYRL
ncbi:hypothetical protein Ahy_B01g052024 isoform B [Arachis hypogaea]|uniref:Uncharacterized protein n=1 Tax=Arachis hypogaea TaxID=3818 RepID=A0A445AND0_ARAHY|nr:hypothetical protein Ahy_B01g052024 isoform B [Arachis hypogaea]